MTKIRIRDYKKENANRKKRDYKSERKTPRNYQREYEARKDRNYREERISRNKYINDVRREEFLGEVKEIEDAWIKGCKELEEENDLYHIILEEDLVELKDHLSYLDENVFCSCDHKKGSCHIHSIGTIKTSKATIGRHMKKVNKSGKAMYRLKKINDPMHLLRTILYVKTKNPSKEHSHAQAKGGISKEEGLKVLSYFREKYQSIHEDTSNLERREKNILRLKHISFYMNK